MSAPETIRTGQKPTRAETTGALNSAARSGCCTAQFFGTASPSTKITTISKTVAATTPQAPNQSEARMPTRVATTSWQTSTSRSTGLRNPCGISVRRASTRAPRRPSSTRARALARLMRTRLVSARASTAEAASSTTTTTIRTKSAGVNDRVASSTSVGGVTAPGGDSGRAAAARGAPSARPRLVLVVVHAEQMEDPVDDQQRHLVVEGDPVLGGVPGGHRRADHHVAEQEGRRVSVLVVRPGPGAALVGRAASPAGARPRWGRPGRRSAPASRGTAVQRGDGVLVDEEQGHLGVASGTLGLEHRSGESRPSLDGDRMVRLLVGGVDVKAHRHAPAAPGARRRRRCRPRCGAGPRRAG